MTDMGIKVIEIAYHRNGVNGSGFHVVRFKWYERGERQNHNNMLAIVFEAADHVAVLDADKLPVIVFGVNSWRGDDFEPELRAAIKAWTDMP